MAMEPLSLDAVPFVRDRDGPRTFFFAGLFGSPFEPAFDTPERGARSVLHPCSGIRLTSPTGPDALEAGLEPEAAVVAKRIERRHRPARASLPRRAVRTPRLAALPPSSGDELEPPTTIASEEIP